MWSKRREHWVSIELIFLVKSTCTCSHSQIRKQNPNWWQQIVRKPRHTSYNIVSTTTTSRLRDGSHEQIFRCLLNDDENSVRFNWSVPDFVTVLLWWRWCCCYCYCPSLSASLLLLLLWQAASGSQHVCVYVSHCNAEFGFCFVVSLSPPFATGSPQSVITTLCTVWVRLCINQNIFISLSHSFHTP